MPDQTAETDKLIAEMIPAAAIFCENEEHLADMRARARKRFFAALTGHSLSKLIEEACGDKA